ncbi:hypothetical protein OEZ86_005121 [Tetradesmus obliquus]|nr:hypothetical protein OEZ86_005121 [Tetradesmus obliquus]
MSLMQKTRASAAFAPSASSRPVCIRPLASSRSSLQVVAFREGDSKRGATGVSKKKAANMQRAARPGTGSSSSAKGGKQRFITAPNAPRTKKEESESVVAFVAVATLFLTGVLFTFPALLGGSPATTKPLQAGINKTFGIEDRSADQSVRGKPYAEGPGPAAAPGTAATR